MSNSLFCCCTLTKNAAQTRADASENGNLGVEHVAVFTHAHQRRVRHLQESVAASKAAADQCSGSMIAEKSRSNNELQGIDVEGVPPLGRGRGKDSERHAQVPRRST